LNSAAGNVLHGLSKINVTRRLDICYFNAIIIAIDESGPTFSKTNNTRIAKVSVYRQK
jgi:hypothetical protein